MRAKFKIVGKVKDQSIDGTSNGGRIVAVPVYSQDPNDENKTFWESTPSGTLDMWLNKPGAYAFFQLDKEYYLDFTPVEQSPIMASADGPQGSSGLDGDANHPTSVPPTETQS